ncbi:UNVERIFIED_CONTAM: hypothetical protein PYX00_007143 [Menopon gallinae]|uniref:HNH homing endonuclease n=1 Tax=Menopon gallinae TaxID=328185 RepID=A0AAW2HIL9_9NEOP
MASKKGKFLCDKCIRLEKKNRRRSKFKDFEAFFRRKNNRKNQEVTAWIPVTKPQYRQNSSVNSRFPGIKEECCCSQTGKKITQRGGGLLKRKMSSIVANYLNKEMNQVASFIVKSAARFGRDHPPAIPEEGALAVQQLTPRFEERRHKKIRFRIPEGTFGYEDAKKAMWKRDNNWDMMKNVPTKYPLFCKTQGWTASTETIMSSIQTQTDLVHTDIQTIREVPCARQHVRKRLSAMDIWRKIRPYTPKSERAKLNRSCCRSKCRNGVHNS